MKGVKRIGANIELDIFLKEMSFSFNSIFSVLKEERLYVRIKEFQIFDDWEYTNEENIDPEAIDLDASDLFLKKFTRTYFVVNNTWRCTLLTSFENASIINLSFGVDTDNLMLLGNGSLDDHIGLVYENAIRIIDENMRKQPFQDHFCVATMGIEYSVDFHNDVMSMITKSNGGSKWIVPGELCKGAFLKEYAREEKSNIIVFTKKL